MRPIEEIMGISENGSRVSLLERLDGYKMRRLEDIEEKLGSIIPQKLDYLK